MLQAQVHFTATQERYLAMKDAVEASSGYSAIAGNFHAQAKLLTLPRPVCWIEITNPAHSYRQGFVLKEMARPNLLKLYTFQQRTNNSMFLPSVVGVQTTLDVTGLHTVARGNWLPEDEGHSGIDNLQKLMKFVLALNPRFEGCYLSFETGDALFNNQPAPPVDPEKIITANRERRYPFFELSYVKSEPDLPPMRYGGPVFDGPKFK